MNKKTIHAPDYRKGKIGYTMAPTDVLQDPKAWGLEKNDLIVYCFLLSRSKKEQYFNGRVLQGWLYRKLGKSAVMKALQKLTELGFCTKTPQKQGGKYMGWSYSFYAFPIVRQAVEKVKPELASKLDEQGWFKPIPSACPPPDNQPAAGNPPDGQPPSLSKGIEEEKESVEERTNQKLSPNPLSQKEGESYETFPGEVEEHKTNNNSLPGHLNPSSSWISKLNNQPIGRRILEALRPEQISGEQSLRSLHRAISKGIFTPDYLTYLEDKVILPNQYNYDHNSGTLMDLSAFLEQIKSGNFRKDNIEFTYWKKHRLEHLKRRWADSHNNLERQKFDEECAKVRELRPFEGPGIDDPQFLSGKPSCPPFNYLGYFLIQEREGQNGAQDIVKSITHPPIWEHLIREAETSPWEYLALAILVQIQLKNSGLPARFEAEILDLYQNYEPRHLARRKELSKEFARLGVKPPSLQAQTSAA